jgi:hypothetical protein
MVGGLEGAVPMDIVSSSQVRPRHLKMLFWGDSGTRKTESILRCFPDVLLVDTEGNAEQCAGMPEIPEFLLAKTKDVDAIIRLVDEVAQGRYHFPDGRPVQTLALDSISVLWTIRKDARSLVAEQRSARYGRSPEEATLTQLDWTMAKRPLVRLNTRLANCPIKYVIYTARLQDKYREDPKNRERIVKVGEVPEAVKGLDYDMNLVLRMRFADDDGSWQCEVTKVQGALGKALPRGKVLKSFPIKTILQHTEGLTGEPGVDQDETRLAEESARRESARAPVAYDRLPRPAARPDHPELAAFYAKAGQLGYRTETGEADRQRVNAVLRANGIRGYSADREHELLSILRQAVEA